MRQLLRLRLVSFAWVLFLATFPLSGHAASTVPAVKDAKKAAMLFVLRADTGVITQVNHVYTLSLQGMDSKVLYFSDRPVRASGFMALSQFINDWTQGNNSFQKNPPNAAIVHAALKSNGKGLTQGIPVELSNPLLSAKGCSFQLKALQETLSEGSYKDISIFVDNSYRSRRAPGVYITE